MRVGSCQYPSMIWGFGSPISSSPDAPAVPASPAAVRTAISTPGSGRPMEPAFHGAAGTVGDGHQGLGLTVAVQNGRAGKFLPAGQELRVDRFAGGDGLSQPREIVGGGILQHQLAQFGGRGAKTGDAVLCQQIKAFSGFERPVVKQHGRAAAPWTKQDAGARLGPAGVGGAPDAILRVQDPASAARRFPRSQCAGGMGDALG